MLLMLLIEVPAMTASAITVVTSVITVVAATLPVPTRLSMVAWVGLVGLVVLLRPLLRHSLSLHVPNIWEDSTREVWRGRGG